MQIPGPLSKDPDPGSMEGLGICILTKCPGGPDAGALIHLTLKMPLTGSASSGDDDSQFWEPQKGEEAQRGPPL